VHRSPDFAVQWQSLGSVPTPAMSSCGSRAIADLLLETAATGRECQVFPSVRSLCTIPHTHCTPGCGNSVSPTVLHPRRPVCVLYTNNLAKSKCWCRGNARRRGPYCTSEPSPGTTQTGVVSLDEHFHCVQSHRRRSDGVELASSGECQTPLSGSFRLSYTNLIRIHWNTIVIVACQRDIFSAYNLVTDLSTSNFIFLS
jgi:hypothetical protein